jgi:CRP-like cAMP-binding protein
LRGLEDETLKELAASAVWKIFPFAKRPNLATAMALEESGIWLILRCALEQVLFSYPHTALQIMENMTDRFIDLVALTADLSLRSVEARLAKYWLEQAKDSVIPRYRWSTLTELAARLGTVSDALSRAIRELTKAGLVEVDKQQVRVLNPEELAKRAMIQID